MKAYAMIVVPMVIYGTLPVFVSKIPYASAEIVMWRTMIGFAVLGLIFLFTLKKHKPVKNKKHILILLAAGMLMGVSWIALFESYAWVNTGIATLAYYMSPVIVMCASIPLFKEKAGVAKIFGIISAILGMVIVTGVNLDGADPVRGVLLGLLAAVLYAAVVLTDKSVRDIGGLELTLIQLAGALLFVIPYTILTHSGPWMDFTSQAGFLTFILGFVHAGLALYMYFLAIQMLPVQSIALCSYLDPASALFFSAVFLGDTLTPIQLAGATLILGGAAAGEILGGRRQSAKKPGSKETKLPD